MLGLEVSPLTHGLRTQDVAISGASSIQDELDQHQSSLLLNSLQCCPNFRHHENEVELSKSAEAGPLPTSEQVALEQ